LGVGREEAVERLLLAGQHAPNQFLIGFVHRSIRLRRLSPVLLAASDVIGLANQSPQVSQQHRD
ncbi:MAG: hypothetical protein ACREXP_29215, partial [Steroidobacteraceae bacterium]